MDNPFNSWEWGYCKYCKREVTLVGISVLVDGLPTGAVDLVKAPHGEHHYSPSKFCAEAFRKPDPHPGTELPDLFRLYEQVNASIKHCNDTDRGHE